MIDASNFQGQIGINCLERFWAKILVKSQNECWEWLGAFVESGYPVFHLPRTIDSKGRRMQKMVYAHRFLWEVVHREPIPFGMSIRLIMHSCDNAGCMNPLHISKGTQRDNIQDCISKGRFTQMTIYLPNYLRKNSS